MREIKNNSQVNISLVAAVGDHMPSADEQNIDANPWSLKLCPVCQSSERTDYATFPELTFSQCSSCDVVYKSREVTGLRSADFYEGGYFTHKGGRRLRRFNHRKNKARRLLISAQQFINISRVMDVGCAAGEVIGAAKDLGLAGEGCDVSRFAVEHCQRQGLEAKVGTLEQLPATDHSLDLVVMKHVLEHTSDPMGALAEVKRTLRPTGGVLIVVPDLNYWKGRWWKKRGRYFRPKALGRQHQVYYQEKNLVDLLQRAGFNIHATSKAVRRRTHGSVAGLLEAVRFVGVALWQAAAKSLFLRREIVVVAGIAGFGADGGRLIHN